MGIFFRRKNRNNNSNQVNNTAETDIDLTKIKNSKMKVHICGLWENYETIVNEIFNQNNKINEDKNDNLNMTYKEYENILITQEIIKEIETNIEDDKSNKKDPIDNHVMLCFGDDNDLEMVLEEFCDSNKPRIIIITNKIKEVNKGLGKRLIKNIITEGMSEEEELKNYINESLKDIYNYYNEKNNKKINESSCDINILLTGMRLAGKSTFVNIFYGKQIAFESNNTEYGSLNISEYEIYRDDINNKNGIKLIDTPGMSENEKLNNKSIKSINNFINNKEKNKINFILFFYFEGMFLGHSLKLLKLLNKCNFPVFFIINKSFDRSNKGKCQDIKTKIKYLKQNGCKNLADEKNFIQVNIKKTTGQFYGMDKIFQKIQEKISTNKIHLDNKIIEDIKYYINKNDWDKEEIEIIKKKFSI